MSHPFDRYFGESTAQEQPEIETESNGHEPREAQEPYNFVTINFGVRRRQKVPIKSDSAINMWIKHKFCCKQTHELLSTLYYLPDYRSKCMTYNYLIGVAESVYYSLDISQLKIGRLQTRTTSCVLYCEIIKCVDKPLGYNSTNLPKKSYLVNLLYTLYPDHILFTLPNVEINLPCTEDGIYFVPESCRAFIKPVRPISAIFSGAAIRSGRRCLFNELKRNARVVSKLEISQYALDTAKTDLKQMGGFAINQDLQDLDRLLSHIV